MLFLRSLFLGIIAALMALILELIFSFLPGFSFESFSREISWFLAVFVLIEELLKISFIWKIFSLDGKKNSPLSFFFQAIFVGLGFALTEALLEIYGLLPQKSDLLGSFLPLLGAIAIHIGVSGFIGFLLVKAQTITFRIFSQVIIVTFSWHFLFNLFVIRGEVRWTALLLLGMVFFLALAALKIVWQQKTYAQQRLAK